MTKILFATVVGLLLALSTSTVYADECVWRIPLPEGPEDVSVVLHAEQPSGGWGWIAVEDDEGDTCSVAIRGVLDYVVPLPEFLTFCNEPIMPDEERRPLKPYDRGTWYVIGVMFAEDGCAVSTYRTRHQTFVLYLMH